jgi:hypothetical protein
LYSSVFEKDIHLLFRVNEFFDCSHKKRSFHLLLKRAAKNNPIVTIGLQKLSLPIVQALAPCRLVGCCVVIGLVPHTLLIDTKNIKFTKLYTKLELKSIVRNV